VLDRLAAGYVAGYFAALAAAAAGLRVPVLLDVAFYPLGLVIAWANWRNSRIEWLDGRTRLAWRLLAAAALVLWLTGSVWTLWVALMGRTAFIDWVDRAAVFQYVMAIAAYLAFPAQPISARARWRFLLDVALLVVAGSVIALYVGVRLALHDTTSSMTVHVVEWSLDSMLFVVAAIGCTAKRDRVARHALVFLLFASILSVSGNFVLALVPASQYRNGHPVDGFWFGAWVLRWIAARVAWHRYAAAGAREAVPAEPEYRSNPFSWVLVAGAFILLFVQILKKDEVYLVPLALAAMGMGMLLVLRQFAELEGNRRLLRQQVERESRFTSLVAHSSDVILVIDGAGVVTYVSPSLTRVFGGDVRLPPGSRLQDVMTPDDAAALSAVLAGAAPGTSRFESRVQLVPGRWREVEAVWRDLRRDPAVNGIVVNCRDVTDRNEIERHLRHAQKLDAMGHLAGGLAHDLNNVLAVIRGYSELLHSELGEGSPASADLAQMMKAVDRASSVTQKVLAFSRKQPGRRARLDLNDVVRDLRPMFGHLLKDQVEVRLSLDPSLWPIQADHGQMEQVLINLATNARDAMPDGGALSITTANRTFTGDGADPRSLPAGEYVAVEMRDEGVGMSAEVLSHIFEPFFSTKPQDRGLGLGLAIVHGIIADLDGRVLVESAAGRGSTFTVLVPRGRASAAPPA
jgi:PAS domain S-box-containing protein